MTKLRALIVASLVLVGTVVGVALNAAAAGAQGTSWTQTTTCPSGSTLTIHASSLRTRTSGTGSHVWWSVTGDVTVTAVGGRSLSYAESYVGRDSSPSD